MCRRLPQLIAPPSYCWPYALSSTRNCGQVDCASTEQNGPQILPAVLTVREYHCNELHTASVDPARQGGLQLAGQEKVL
jgi:hypothetical protein